MSANQVTADTQAASGGQTNGGGHEPLTPFGLSVLLGRIAHISHRGIR